MTTDLSTILEQARDAAERRAAWAAQDKQHQIERWRWIVKEYGLQADGHRLTAHGAHTGHMITTVALCETTEMAMVIAEALKPKTQE